jgi:hypothetical protein
MTKDQDTVARSYQLLALLEVCEHSAREIGDHSSKCHAGSLASVLRMARDVAGEIHDEIEARFTTR